jgi:hypothetical protein
MLAYVSIRQHTSAYLRALGAAEADAHGEHERHLSAHVSIRQHTPAYVSIRQHNCASRARTATVSIRDAVLVMHALNAAVEEQKGERERGKGGGADAVGPCCHASIVPIEP